MTYTLRSLLFLVCLSLTACATSIPEGITPVKEFDLQRYLGTWYEIARLDHRFERGLSQVTANYSLRDDGSVKVINRGFSDSNQDFKEAVGTAKFVNDPSIGHLKVSFFGPFYGSYIVVNLADDYSSAMVAGPNRNYLWILSRESTLEASRLEELISLAMSFGYETSELILPDHSLAADRN